MAKTKPTPIAQCVSLLSEAINNGGSDEGARLLVKRALNVAYENHYPEFSIGERKYDVKVTNKEIDGVLSLIRGVNPRDSVEAILAAQFVALHLQGMSTIISDDTNAKGHGMMMLRLSHQALETLQRYRGKSQTINVNYNVLNQGDTFMNTLIQAKGKEKNGE